MSNLFHDHNKDGDVQEPNSKSGNIIFQIPESEEKAIVCKLVKDAFSGDSCVKLRYFKHMIGNSDKDTRYHVCRDSLGLGRSPENEYFWELVNKLKELKDSGVDKDSPEYKEVLETKKFFSPKNGGYLFFIEPNSSKFMALKVGPMVFNRLFGRKKTEYSAEIPSLIKEMSEKGMYPYLDADMNANKTGWVKIWKTGTGLSTEYHLEIAKHEEEKTDESGDKFMITRWTKYDLSDAVVSIIKGESELDIATFPNVVEFEKKNVWTEEESDAFVEAEGALEGTPIRLFSNDDNDKADDDGSKDSNNHQEESASAKPANLLTGGGNDGPTLDDIPF